MPVSPNATRRRFLSASAALGAGAMGVGAYVPAAMAQSGKWPNKPIRIIVAFPPGGLTDAYARLYADQLSAKTGQSVVVDNRPGAGAVIAIDLVAKAPADGYTLLMTTSGTVWQNRVLTPSCPITSIKTSRPSRCFLQARWWWRWQTRCRPRP